MRAALWLSVLGGCDFLLSTDSGGNQPPIRLDTVTRNATTDGSGRVEVEIDVPPDAVAFQVTGDSNQYVSVEKLVSPTGNVVLDYHDWVYSSYSLTYAFFPTRTTVAFDWPVRKVDGPLTPGVWTATLATTDESYYFTPFTPITVSSTLKFDPSFATGDISVQIVYASGVDSDPDVVAAVEAAVVRWAEVWAGQGLNLYVSYASSSLPKNLSFTYVGSADVEAVAQAKGDAQMQLIIGETVRGDDYIFGVSAGIPGTLQPTPNTFVVLAWLTHAGINGAFDADEIRLMGETMAHECGHYTGLFHPVEATYDRWDALDDTPDCGAAGSCDNQLGSNLMYPYPICTASTCFPQGDLSFQQGQIMQQYMAAL